MIKLKKILFEKNIAHFKKNIVIDITINKSKHAEERQHRVNDFYFSDEYIIKIANNAIPQIIDLIIKNEIKAKTRILIKYQDLNMVCALHYLDYERYKLDIITVMKKSDFKNLGRAAEIIVTEQTNIKTKKLYFTVSISGAGKSTYLKKHFPKEVIVSPDEIRRNLSGDVNNQSINVAAWQQAYSDLQTLLDTRNIAVLDATNVNDFYRKMALDKFKDNNIKKIALVFNVEPEVAKRRIQIDIEKGIDRANVPPEIIDKQYNEFKKNYKNLFIQFDEVKVIE